MYAKKNKKPMYGNGGAIKYQNGGPVKSDSTKVAPIDLFGIDAVLAAKDERDAEMQGLSEADKLRKAFGIAEGGADLDLFGIDAVLDAREAKGLSRNPLDDLKPISDKAKDALEKLRVYFGISDAPEGKTAQYRKGGMMKYPGGGMMPRKYEQGGPVGSASSDQKFRVIPEKSPTGQTELAYYIDGRPVDSQAFQQQFYGAGNKPQDLNQLIENSVVASKQGVGAESLISGGSPLEGLMKQYRDALKERNVYKEQGAAGIDSLYNARNENYEEMLRRMGG